MKKCLVCLLVMAMLVAGALALAEAAEQDVFELRNGIRFHMTPDEVIAAEGKTPDFDMTDDATPWHIIGWFNVDVSKYTAQFNCGFIDGQMYMAVYAMPDQDAGTFDYLQNALSSVYGSVRVPDMDRLFALMASTSPEGIDPQQLTFQMTGWEAQEGIKVALMTIEGDGTYIVYYDGNYDYTALAQDDINTNGL